MKRIVSVFIKKVQEFKEIEKQEKMESRTITNGDITICFNGRNRAQLYYKNTELTKHFGLSLSMLSEGVHYHSYDSEFKVEKISSDRIKITSEFNALPFSHIWDMKIIPGNSISLDINMHIKEPMRIDRRNVTLFLTKSYEDWIAPPEQGKFPDAFGSEWLVMNSNHDCSEFVGLSSPQEELPSIVFRTYENTKASLLIQNSDLNLSSRVLGIHSEDKDEFYQPGVYPYIKVIIQLYPDKPVLNNIVSNIVEEHQKRKVELQEEERKRQEGCIRKAAEEDRKLRTLRNKFIRVFFDKENRFHICYKDKELTKGYGLITGIFSEGIWYNLLDSEVKIERPSPDEMAIEFSHNKLPFTQLWRLKFNAEEILALDIDMHIKEPLRIDRRNAVLFLSKIYKDWVAPPEKGKFPDCFGHDWQTVNPGNSRAEFIGLISSLEELPGIVFRPSADTKALLLVQNTDLSLSSRALGIQFEDEDEFYKPGTYPYLKAVIQLYPDKSVLENIVARIIQKHQEQEAGKASAKLKEESGLIVSEKGYRNNICIYGDSEESHNKAGSKTGDFQKTIAKIKTAVKNKTEVKIGITKFNFFKLNKIIQFCSALMKYSLDLRSVSLPLFPVNKLYSNFIDYVKELNTRIGQNRISLFLKDNDLLELLHSVSSQADQYNERDLLRLLGVISEHPFIGPQTVVLDTYHRCNTNCIHCWINTPQRNGSARADNLKMDNALYKSIIDDAADILCDEIIIQGDGEPLLDKRFMEMVSYAKQKGLKVLFFTNAILLDEKKAKKIISLGINEIFCSLPAGTDKTYAVINSMQSKSTFHKIVGNLRNLVLIRNKLKKKHPLLQMTHVIHNLNFNELEEMAKIGAYMGADKVRFYLARLDDNTRVLKLEPRHIEAMKSKIGEIELFLKERNISLQDNIHFQLENYNSKTGYWSENKFFKTGCPVGWFFCLILARGELSMCCHLRVVDYLNEKSLKKAWNSENYNRFRTQAKYLMSNKDVVFPNGVKLFDEFCNNCDTHQVILMINDLMQKYNLHKFL